MSSKTFNGIRYLPVDTMREKYKKRFPEKVPNKGKPQTNILMLSILVVCLVAVNILSGAHTIPTILEFYNIGAKWLVYLIGTSGFLAIEGFMFVLMAQEDRSKWGIGVIVLAFVAAMSSNLYGTFHVFSEQLQHWALVPIALVFGMFAPMANLIAGEVVHNMQVKYLQEKRELEAAYEKELGEFVRAFEGWYKSYLTRVGIKSQEHQQLILAGILEDEELSALPEPELPTVTVEKPEVELNEAGIELFNRLKNDGYLTSSGLSLTYKQVYSKYLGGKKNPNLVADVKKYAAATL